MHQEEGNIASISAVQAPTGPGSSHVRLAESDFWNTFKPIRNPSEADGPWDGCFFETYGEDLDFVLDTCKRRPRCVWTILDCDGEQVVVSGYQTVNRFGYLITQVQAEEGLKYEIGPDCGE